MELFHAVWAILVFAVVDARSLGDEPLFCHNLDCPDFKTVNKTDKFELRFYPKPYKWVSTIVADYEYDKAVPIGFMRLFDYIQGKNEQKEKIDMTAPVAVEIQPGQGPFCKDNFTVSFFVPFKHQSNPPVPSDKDVFISTFGAFYAYVTVFGGYAELKYIQQHSAQLIEALNDAGLSGTYREDMFYFAGYDSPFRVFGRHNELWFLRKDSLSIKPVIFQ